MTHSIIDLAAQEPVRRTDANTPATRTRPMRGAAAAQAGAASRPSLVKLTGSASRVERAISAAMTPLLADMFALYLKTVRAQRDSLRPRRHNHHLMLGEQAEEILDLTEMVSEHLARPQPDPENAGDVESLATLAELGADNIRLAKRLREIQAQCRRSGDCATARLLERWIDEAEGRAWFLFENGRAMRSLCANPGSAP